MMALSPKQLRGLIRDGGRPAVKTARVLARQMIYPFAIDTAQGRMTGNGGDWLVTNHPADDPSSDYWPVNAERFEQTYRLVDESTVRDVDKVIADLLADIKAIDAALPAPYPIDGIGALVGIRAVLARSIREHDNSVPAIDALRNIDVALVELTKG